jgi:hypothetical protein
MLPIHTKLQLKVDNHNYWRPDGEWIQLPRKTREMRNFIAERAERCVGPGATAKQRELAEALAAAELAREAAEGTARRWLDQFDDGDTDGIFQRKTMANLLDAAEKGWLGRSHRAIPDTPELPLTALILKDLAVIGRLHRRAANKYDDARNRIIAYNRRQKPERQIHLSEPDA